MTIDRDLIDRIAKLAATSPTPIGSMSMSEIATQLGMARMTLYRRAGSREDIVAALLAEGIDARTAPDVQERVVEATAALLAQHPLAELTLERIAAEAECSLPAVYARFGNRVGILKAVVERYSPLIPVREAIAADMAPDDPDLRHDIHLLYGTVLPRVLHERRLLQALLAEVLRDPANDIGRAFREWYLPQVTSVLMPLFARHIEAGTIRPLPLPILVHLLMGPLVLHAASRRVIVEEYGIELPDIDVTVDLLTDMFCRAVAAEIAHEPTAGVENDHD
jgi:AcrR family transcriptional regulator